MIKRLTPIIFLFCCTSSYSQNSDSSEIIRISKELNELKKENEELAFKLEVYNEANNKLLEPSYALLALIFGLGIWNAIQSYRIGKKEIESVRESLKNEMVEDIKLRLKTLDVERNNKFEYLSNSLKRQILKNRIGLIKLNSVTIRNGDINTEGFRLVELIDASYELCKSSGDSEELKHSFKHTLNYLEQYLDTIKRDEYETGLLKSRIESIDVEPVADIKRKILELFSRK